MDTTQAGCDSAPGAAAPPCPPLCPPLSLRRGQLWLGQAGRGSLLGQPLCCLRLCGLRVTGNPRGGSHRVRAHHRPVPSPSPRCLLPQKRPGCREHLRARAPQGRLHPQNRADTPPAAPLPSATQPGCAGLPGRPAATQSWAPHLGSFQPMCSRCGRPLRAPLSWKRTPPRDTAWA